MTANDYDFSRSFVRYASLPSNNAPRKQVEAVCHIPSANGKTARYYLTCACLGETMFAAADLIQKPVARVFLVVGEGGDFMFLKYHASAQWDRRDAIRVGQRIPTWNGRGARIVKAEVQMARHPRLRRLESPEDIRQALRTDAPLNARTSVVDADGRTRYVMDYPVKTFNLAADGRWQVDTGPVLALDSSSDPGAVNSRLIPGFVVFNAWDWAELALLKAAPPGDGSPPLAYYSDVRRIRVRNELFCGDG